MAVALLSAVAARSPGSDKWPFLKQAGAISYVSGGAESLVYSVE